MKTTIYQTALCPKCKKVLQFQQQTKEVGPDPVEHRFITVCCNLEYLVPYKP